MFELYFFTVSLNLTDIFALNEHGINYKHKDNRRHNFTQLFTGSKTLVRGSARYNRMEIIDDFIQKRTREGGTGMVTFGEVAGLMDPKTLGVDKTALSHYIWMEFRGADGHCTMVLSGYCP